MIVISLKIKAHQGRYTSSDQTLEPGANRRAHSIPKQKWLLITHRVWRAALWRRARRRSRVRLRGRSPRRVIIAPAPNPAQTARWPGVPPPSAADCVVSDDWIHTRRAAPPITNKQSQHAVPPPPPSAPTRRLPPTGPLFGDGLPGGRCRRRTVSVIISAGRSGGINQSVTGATSLIIGGTRGRRPAGLNWAGGRGEDRGCRYVCMCPYSDTTATNNLPTCPMFIFCRKQFGWVWLHHWHLMAGKIQDYIGQLILMYANHRRRQDF